MLTLSCSLIFNSMPFRGEGLNMGRSTMDLLIALSIQGDLRCAVFPTTGMPEIPRPRLPHLKPEVRQAIMNVLPQQIQSLPEPRLSCAIMNQQQRGLQTLGSTFP